MAVLVDHVFLCCAAGVPAAEKLRQAGLTEGSPNQHPGQGTACRRFFFQNAMLELLWVENAVEAKSAQSQRIRIWERWSARGDGASPFGIILRPQGPPADACPFPAWDYRPVTMPDLVLQVAAGAGLDEPMWCFMPAGRPPREAPLERRQPLEHTAGLQNLTSVRLTSPPLPAASTTQAMAGLSVIALVAGPEHLLELKFDDCRQGRSADFRPDLPLILSW